MRYFFLLGIIFEWHDLLPFQVGQSFVIATTQCFSHNTFHDGGFTFLIKSHKSIIIQASINKFYIHGHMTFADKEIIVEDSPNATISIHKGVNVFKGKVKLGYPLDDVVLTARLVGDEHLLDEF